MRSRGDPSGSPLSSAPGPVVMARITGLEPDPRRPERCGSLVDGQAVLHGARGRDRPRGARGRRGWTPERAAQRGGLPTRRRRGGPCSRRSSAGAMRPADLRRRLVRKGHPPEAVDHAIARASRRGCWTMRSSRATTWIPRGARPWPRRGSAATSRRWASPERTSMRPWPSNGRNPRTRWRSPANWPASGRANSPGSPVRYAAARLLAFLARRGFTGARDLRARRLRLLRGT